MYYLIFIYTLLLSLNTSWTYNNFTFLSYQNDLRIHYLIWVTIIACFLLYKVNRLFNQITYKTLNNKLIIILSFLSLLVGSYLPYHPDNENIVSILHIILSSLGALSLLLIIQLLINRIMLIDFDYYKKMTALYRSQILILTIFIVMFGAINSIVELFYIYLIFNSLKKIENHFN